MELNEINISENKGEEDTLNINSKSAESNVKDHSYINTTLVVANDINEKCKRENHVYEDLNIANNKTCMTRFKQYKDWIMLILIGVLYIALTVLVIFIGLPEKSAINGEWSVWSAWETCSATCGTGMQRRNRTCSNQAPDERGKPCVGDVSETQLCDKKACEGINGGWSVWGSWSHCSVTCDYGMTYRERTCSNPIPSMGGLFCSGSFNDFRLCNDALCPALDGKWSAWSAWGTCSAACGTGLQRRTRTCSNPAPDPHGRSCFGDVSEQQLCNIKSCDGTGIGFTVYLPQTGTPVKFVYVLFNYNNVYNTTTGEFVCPKRGLYFFQVTLIRQSLEPSSSYCVLYQNSIQRLSLYMSSSVNYPHASASVLFDLLPGDRIYISSCGNLGAFDGYSTFSGFLINTV